MGHLDYVWDIMSLSDCLRKVLKYEFSMKMWVAGFDCLEFMTTAAADVDHENRIIFLSTRKFLRDLLFEWKEIEPVCSTISLSRHPGIKVIKIFLVMWNPLECSLLRVESFLKRTFYNIGGVSMVRFPQKGRYGHDRRAYRVKCVVDASFETGDSQIAGDIGSEIKILSCFANCVHRRKISEKSSEKPRIGADLLSQLIYSYGMWTVGKSTEDV